MENKSRAGNEFTVVLRHWISCCRSPARKEGLFLCRDGTVDNGADRQKCQREEVREIEAGGKTKLDVMMQLSITHLFHLTASQGNCCTTSAHTHTLTFPFHCSESLKQPRGKCYCSKVAVLQLRRHNGISNVSFKYPRFPLSP